MTPRDLTGGEIAELIDTHDAATGLLYPPAGLQPYHDWLLQTLHRLAASSAADLRVSLSSTGASDVCVAPGRASIAGTVLAYTGETLALGAFNNDTALVWLEEDVGEPEIGVAASAMGWPVGAHIKLAEVVLAGGDITAITDRRFETILKA